MELFVTRALSCCSRSDGDVIFATQERASLESSRRRASVRVTVAVGGMFANRYIFISQLLAQRVGPCVYIRRYVTHRAAETPTFRANKTSYPRAHHRSIFRLYCPLHLIWRPRSPLMDPRISRFSSAKGCANRSVIRAGFSWGFLRNSVVRLRTTSQNPHELFLFQEEYRQLLKSENSDGLPKCLDTNTICNKHFDRVII